MITNYRWLLEYGYDAEPIGVCSTFDEIKQLVKNHDPSWFYRVLLLDLDTNTVYCAVATYVNGVWKIRKRCWLGDEEVDNPAQTVLDMEQV